MSAPASVDVADLCFTARALAQSHPMTEASHRYRQACVERERQRQRLPEPADWAGTALLVGYCLRRAEERHAQLAPADPTGGTQGVDGSPVVPNAASTAPAHAERANPNTANAPPADPNTASTPPADPNTASTAPADPNTANAAPADPNTANAAPADPNTASTAPVDPNAASTPPAEAEPADANDTNAVDTAPVDAGPANAALATPNIASVAPVDIDEERVAAITDALRTGDAGRVSLLSADVTVAALDRLIATELDKRQEHLREQLDDEAWSELGDYIAWWLIHGYALRSSEFPSP